MHASPISLQPAPPAIAFDESLVRKYDGFGPRYTSYPTADRFHDRFTADDYVDALESRVAGAPLSLYVHVPFCNTICYYCACNKIVTKNHGRAAKYVRYLGREIEIVGGLVGRHAAGNPGPLGRRHADVPVAAEMAR